jgi:ABC-type multidrug transport system fused ATPase/permease subunit
LTRLLDYEGQLLINDVDARKYDPDSIHDSIAACFQDFSKLPMTLRENICCGNLRRADDEQTLNNALEASGVADFLDDRQPLYIIPEHF